MTDVHEFDNISSARASEDGTHVALTLTGIAGVMHIALPAAAIPGAISLLMEGATAADQVLRGPKVMRALKAQAMGLTRSADGTKVYLRIQLAPERPALAFEISRENLIRFAQGILQTEGMVPSREIPPREQN